MSETHYDEHFDYDSHNLDVDEYNLDFDEHNLDDDDARVPAGWQQLHRRSRSVLPRTHLLWHRFW